VFSRDGTAAVCSVWPERGNYRGAILVFSGVDRRGVLLSGSTRTITA
jgi:hypothetical protein